MRKGDILGLKILAFLIVNGVPVLGLEIILIVVFFLNFVPLTVLVVACRRRDGRDAVAKRQGTCSDKSDA